MRLLPGNLRSPVNIFRPQWGPQVPDRCLDKRLGSPALQNKSCQGVEIYRGIMKNDPRRRWRGSTSTAINRIAVFDVSSNLYLDIGRSIVGLFVARIPRAEAGAASCLSIDASISAEINEKHTFVVLAWFFDLIFSSFFSFWSMMDVEYLFINFFEEWR